MVTVVQRGPTSPQPCVQHMSSEESSRTNESSNMSDTSDASRYLVAPTIDASIGSRESSADGSLASAVRKPQTGRRPKMDFLFPRHPQKRNILDLVQYDDEGLRYITYADTAKRASNRVASIVEDALGKRVEGSPDRDGVSVVMVDGTGGLGGDAIAFGRNSMFSRVYALELDAVRFACLEHNIRAYDLDPYVTCVHGNLLTWMPAHVQSLLSGQSSSTTDGQPTILCLSLDPPWGGDQYRKVDSIKDLSMYDESMKATSIHDVVDSFLAAGVHLILLKLPRNFDTTRLVDMSRERGCSIQYPDLHRNIQYVVIVNHVSFGKIKDILQHQSGSCHRHGSRKRDLPHLSQD